MPGAAPAQETVDAVKSGLDQCVQTNDDGTVSLNLKLPNAEALQALATALAKLLGAQSSPGTP